MIKGMRQKVLIAADDSVQRLSALMQLPSLESIFKELVQQADTEKSAKEIISIIQSNQ